MLLCATDRDERAPARMANDRDTRPLRSDPQPPYGRRGGAVLPRPLHAGGAGGTDAPVAGGATAGPGPSVSRGGGPNGRVDDDGDPGGAVAQARRGRVSTGARPAEARVQSDRLTIAVPAKGRLREPAV